MRTILRRLLTGRFFRTRGYEVDLARNGNDGFRLGSSRCYAVMTIDRMLPGMDGLSIIRKLRESRIDVPALIASVLGEVDDRVRRLRSGGDDCLVKPFASAELLARIEALARRSTTVAKSLRRRYCGSVISNSIWSRAPQLLSRRGLLFDNGPGLKVEMRLRSD